MQKSKPRSEMQEGVFLKHYACQWKEMLGENIFLSEETLSLATPEDAASKQSTSEACRSTRSSWKQKIPRCDRTLLTMALVGSS